MMFDVLQIEREGRTGRDFQFVVSLFPEVCSLARAFLISIHARVMHLPRVSRAGFLGVARNARAIRQLQYPSLSLEG